MSEEKVNNDNVSIISALKTLAALQADLAKLTLAKRSKEAIIAVKNGIAGLEKYVNEQANRYGVEKGKAKDVKDAYKSYIQNEKDIYLEGITALEMDKQDLQGKQMLEIGRACELKRNEKDGPAYEVTQALKKAKSKIEEFDRQIAEKEAAQKECRDAFKTHTKEAWKNKSTELAKVNKQNIFQKFIGSFVDKINGGKKYAESVAKPIAKSLNDFKNETIPAFANSIKEKATDGLDTVKGFGTSEKEKIEGVINKGKEFKSNIIKGIAGKIQDANERVA